MLVARFHHFVTYWDIPSWAVAFGTVFLGGATVWLGSQARNEASAVADEATLSRQQLEASQRPFVLPVTNDWEPLMEIPVKRAHARGFGTEFEWWMMLSNAGAGPAYNVRGGLFWKGGIGGGWELLPISVPSGRDVPARLEVHSGHEVKWAEAVGYLRYSDLAGTEWQTHFRYQQNTASQFFVEVTKFGKTGDLGEPHYVV